MALSRAGGAAGWGLGSLAAGLLKVPPEKQGTRAQIFVKQNEGNRKLSSITSWCSPGESGRSSKETRTPSRGLLSWGKTGPFPYVTQVPPGRESAQGLMEDGRYDLPLQLDAAWRRAGKILCKDTRIT